jgi:archaellum component FlaC
MTEKEKLEKLEREFEYFKGNLALNLSGINHSIATLKERINALEKEVEALKGAPP